MMNMHIAIVHEEKKQFKCEFCYAKFGHKGNLNQHVTAVHDGNKQFQ